MPVIEDKPTIVAPLTTENADIQNQQTNIDSVSNPIIEEKKESDEAQNASQTVASSTETQTPSSTVQDNNYCFNNCYF